MAAIKRSGGVVAFFWTGHLDAAEGTALGQALADRRFRTIENAASEEVSVGWVTSGDPTGDSFDAEDLEVGRGFWLRMRVDKKALPRKWLMIHREAAEKSRGRRLTAKEKRELRDGLMDQLLPRVLPTVQLVDALLMPDRSTVLLFATAKGLRESFGKLFFETFTVPLEQGDPHQMALRAGLDDAMLAQLEGAHSVRWPREAEKEPAATTVTAGLDADREAEEEPEQHEVAS